MKLEAGQLIKLPRGGLEGTTVILLNCSEKTHGISNPVHQIWGRLHTPVSFFLLGARRKSRYSRLRYGAKMKFKAGQLIGYYTDFGNTEKLLANYVIIEVLPELLRLYCIYCHPIDYFHPYDDPYIHQSIEHIKEKSEDPTSFYWRIQNEA